MTRMLFVAVSLGMLLFAAGTVVPEKNLALDTPLDGEQLTGGKNTRCYKLELSDETVRKVVWWESPKLLIRLDPCTGYPHLKVSVYGCPSEYKTVYEFMSTKMRNDAVISKKPVPKDWEWPGDVETLTIDITHKTYFIEVQNNPRQGVTTQVPSEYSLYVNAFDQNSTATASKATPSKKEDMFPLKYMSPWDKKVSQSNTSSAGSGIGFGGGDSSNIVTLRFWPPGGHAAISASALAELKKKKYTYSVYVLDITTQIGDSKTGFFTSDLGTSLFADICPPANSEICTPLKCRSCEIDYPKCPKEFLTDCTETTLNIKKLKDALENATVPFDGRLKYAEKWTAWTVCGTRLTLDRVDQNKAVEKYDTNEARRAKEPVWFAQEGPELVYDPDGSGQLNLDITGLVDKNNNVYLVNVVVKDEASAAASGNRTEHAVYEFMTLQMQTPRYQTPKLKSTDYAVIIGVSVGLGACIIVFVVVALIVRHKRKQRLQKRIRSKK
eukprot:CAMPEP_0114555330 /NCGR_PEP_ID=MMETSP0114-20121206/8691_1 /TAXON_ID=31324 /ORGANISM="Goniomonas sp, Strain m" /LENGTH=495 /DNA_ID=CAMNT_0001740447 /DNA_START=22 /DNA_END=1509 /DNA_ORIENTATION=-